MALRVIGDMHQQTPDRRRHSTTPDVARLFEFGRIEAADTLGARLQSLRQQMQSLARRNVQTAFCFHGLELLIRKLTSFGVGEQPIDAAGNMVKMKRDRSHSAGTLMHLLVCQSPTVSDKVFFGRLQRM